MTPAELANRLEGADQQPFGAVEQRQETLAALLEQVFDVVAAPAL